MPRFSYLAAFFRRTFVDHPDFPNLARLRVIVWGWNAFLVLWKMGMIPAF